jgi:hypothetical protein
MLQQELQTGRFYYKDGAIYEGQYKVVGLPPPTAPEPAKKGAKKKEEEPPAQPAEPPKPVRHGVGESRSGSAHTTNGRQQQAELSVEACWTHMLAMSGLQLYRLSGQPGAWFQLLQNNGSSAQ